MKSVSQVLIEMFFYFRLHFNTPTQFQINIKEVKPLSYYSLYLVTSSRPFYIFSLLFKYDFRLSGVSLFYVVITNCF